MCIQDVVMARTGKNTLKVVPLSTTAGLILPYDPNRWGFILCGLSGGTATFGPNQDLVTLQGINFTSNVNSFSTSIKTSGNLACGPFYGLVAAGTQTICVIETVYNFQEMLAAIRALKGL